MLDLEIDTGTTAFLDRSGQEWISYQRSIRDFGGDEIIVVAFEESRPYDSRLIEKVARFTELFRSIPGVRRVDSVTATPSISVAEDGRLLLEPVVKYPGDVDASGELLGARIQRERTTFLESLVSDDGKVFAINIFLDANVDSSRLDIAKTIVEMLEGTNAWVSGVPIFRTEVNLTTREELEVFVPLTIGLVGVVLLIATGSIFLVFCALSACGVGVWILIGLMGFFGVQLSLSTMILPSVILALGSAYVMHVFSAVDEARSKTELRSAIGKITKALSLSGLTTAIGFLAIASVEIDAIRELGLFGALGVVLVLISVLSFVPAMLALVVGRLRFRFRNGWLRDLARARIVPSAIKRRRVVVLIWVLAFGVSSIGLARVHVETDIVLWFSEDSWIRESFEKIRTALNGITPVSVVVSSEDGRDVTDPVVFNLINELERYLETLPVVGNAISFVDPVARLDERVVRNDGLAEPVLSGDLISQYLLVLSSIDNVRDLVANDRQAANIAILLSKNGSKEILSVRESVEQWWNENGLEGLSATTTGIMYEFARSEEAISRGQARGLGLAFGSVAALLVLIFRRPGLIVATLAPNIIPLILAYGFMGTAGIPLDAATMCLGSLSLGIAVDNTIHIATEFSDKRRQGLRSVEAIDVGIWRVFPALMFSTIAIAIGFAVIGLSDFTLIRNLGVLTAAIVSVCLVADLSLLPALLSYLEPEREMSVDL